MSIYFSNRELDKLDAELRSLLEFEADGERSDFDILREIRLKIQKEQARRLEKQKHQQRDYLLALLLGTKKGND